MRIYEHVFCIVWRGFNFWSTNRNYVNFSFNDALARVETNELFQNRTVNSYYGNECVTGYTQKNI